MTAHGVKTTEIMQELIGEIFLSNKFRLLQWRCTQQFWEEGVTFWYSGSSLHSSVIEGAWDKYQEPDLPDTSFPAPHLTL